MFRCGSLSRGIHLQLSEELLPDCWLVPIFIFLVIPLSVSFSLLSISISVSLHLLFSISLPLYISLLLLSFLFSSLIFFNLSPSYWFIIASSSIIWDTACNAPISRGNVCAGSPQRSLWYFDTATQKCRQFTYNGQYENPDLIITNCLEWSYEIYEICINFPNKKEFSVLTVI